MHPISSQGHPGPDGFEALAREPGTKGQDGPQGPQGIPGVKGARVSDCGIELTMYLFISTIFYTCVLYVHGFI